MQESEADKLRNAEVAAARADPELTEMMQELEGTRASLDESQAALAQLRDSQLRERAEIENQRRRISRDLEQARRFANEKILRELLPVCDNLERGLSVEHPGGEAHREGMQLTLKALLKVMQDNGLSQIDPLGQPFDPEVHEAMSMVEAEGGQAPNTVVAVLEKGYVLNERLLRPARVIVTRGH